MDDYSGALSDGRASQDLFHGRAQADPARAAAPSNGIAAGPSAPASALSLPSGVAAPQDVSAINGTGGDDTLHAAPGGSYIDGLAGDDLLLGDAGNDHLIGNIGNDELTGGAGSDWEEGGDGNDYLHDFIGSDRLDGGAGDDHIVMSYGGDVVGNGIADTITITGGDGADTVEFYVTNYIDRGGTNYGPTGSVDLGTGNDRLLLGSGAVHPLVTLGAGQDRVFADHAVRAITITDFQAGNGGDSLELSNLVFGFQNYTDGANPFATGHLRLVQDGADTIIRADYDGNGPGTGSDYVTDIFRLVGVTASSLTAFNLDGFTPNGGAVVGLTLNGGASGDWLDGEAGNDTINGLDGNDHITGGQGADTIDGGAGDDVIDPGRGNDVVTGGAGNDDIEDFAGGSDTLRGGDGDDVIRLQHIYQSELEHSVIDAGIGNDHVYWYSSGVTSIDLGAGNDYISLTAMPGAGSSVTLGAGMDEVDLWAGITTQTPYSPLVLNDFATGDAGDKLDWLTVAKQVAGYQGDAATFNPFASGNAVLVQDGNNVDLNLVAFGQTTTLVIFKNTHVADFTVHNLGTDPTAPPPLSTVDTLTGTANDDHLTGTAVRDVVSGLGGNDTIDGLDGNDLLRGNDGDDVLNGGLGDDTLQGGAGNDTLNGGDGNDTIADAQGGDTVLGGAGNDTITVETSVDPITMTVGSLDAGAGNDTVTLTGGGMSAAYTVNLGDGDDHLTIKDLQSPMNIALGTGKDVVELGANYSPHYYAVPTITDFQTGAGGDSIDLAAYIGWYITFHSGAGNYALAPGENPFAEGYLALRQVGANVELWVQPDGVAGGPVDTPVMRFTNTNIAQFTADNFGGIAPVASVNDLRLIKTTTTIAAGTTITAHALTSYQGMNAHFVFEGTAGTVFTNNGTIQTTLGDGDLIGLGMSPFAASSPQSLFVNGATGHFSVTSTFLDPSGDREFGKTYGFYAPEISTVFRNDGDFSVTVESGLATGVLAGFDPFNHPGVTNNGTFAVQSAYDAYGVDLGINSAFVNNGTMTVYGADLAIGAKIDEYIDGQFTNHGTLTVTTAALSPYASIGLLIGQNENVTGQSLIVNSGTITADYAVYVAPRTLGTIYMAGEKLVNSGTINGAIDLSYGNDTIANSGTINGHIALGQGNDVYDGRTGHLDGVVEGGNGDDTLLGGVDDDTLVGGWGHDAIDGGAGDDLIYGGTDGDALNGGAGIDTLSYLASGNGVAVDLAAGTATVFDPGSGFHTYPTDFIRGFEAVVGSALTDSLSGSAGDDTLDGNAGADLLTGGAGNDVLIGGTGDDFLSGGAGADSFLFYKGDGNDRISDFGAGDTIEVTGYAGYSALEQTDSGVKMTLSPTDSIFFTGAKLADIDVTRIHFDATQPGPEPSLPGAPFEVTENKILYNGTYDIDSTLNLPDRWYGSVEAGVVLKPAAVAPILENFGQIIIDPVQDSPLLVGVAKSDALYGVGGYANGDGGFLNMAGRGLLDVHSANGDVWGAYAVGESWNGGTVRVTADHGDAIGFNDMVGIVHNYGTIEVTASGHATGIESHNFAIANYGTIDVHGGLASKGIDFSFTVHPAAPVLDFGSAMNVTVVDQTAALDSIGVAYDVDGKARFWLSGKVKADYALAYDQEYSTGPGSIPSDFTIFSSALLDGRVQLSGKVEHLINTGEITGLADLGDGDDSYDGHAGRADAEVRGGGGNDTLIGGNYADQLSGGDGDDILAGGLGSNVLSGGAGHDIFYVQSGAGDDRITDFASGEVIRVVGYSGYQSIVQQGADTLVTFSATQHLLLTGVQASSLTAANWQFNAAALATTAIPTAPKDGVEPLLPEDLGNAAFQPVIGTDGADTLGTGATGPDHFYGLKGDDIYLVDRSDDVVFENAGEGTDTVIASANYYLYANIEKLTLAAGAGNIFGVGNALDNTITGNEGINLLLGGAGNDIVHGGAGVDTIFGEDGADHLFGDADNDFLAGGNGDDVMDGGTGGDSLYGQGGNDVLTGGSDFVFDQLIGGDGNDVLHGDSGLADYDYLYGNAGDDSFYVDTGDDLTFEQPGEGTDTVYANVPGANNGVYLYANIENLVLLGTTTFGVGNELDNHLTGNASVNLLLGGAGNDVINGKGGNDVLFGQAGSDTFVFEHGTGGDVVGDFVPGTDKIDLSAIGYTWQQVQNSFHQNGGDLAIDLGGGDLVVLQGVNASQLHQSDFILSGGASGDAQVPAEARTVSPIAPEAIDHAALLHQLWHDGGTPLLVPTL